MQYSKHLILLVIITMLCIASFFMIYGEVRKNTITDLNSRQTAHARQASKGVQDHFRHLTDMLTILSWQDDIIAMNAAGKTMLHDVQHEYTSEIKGVTRVDARGRIMYTVPVHMASIGLDITGQEHVREIMRAHKPVISDVFTAVQGFRAIAMHVPVFKNGAYAGTLAFLISFDQLAKKYLEDIRIGKNGYAWVISRKGIVIYSPVSGNIGRSVFETYRDSPEIIAMAHRMLDGKTGVMDYPFVHMRGTIEKRTTEHAVYMPIYLDTTFWSIVVATPDDEVASLMESFRAKLFFMTVALFIFMAVFTYFLIKLRIVLREQAKRRSIEDNLRESEEKFRSMAETSPLAIYMSVGVEQKAEYINPMFTKLFGYTLEDVPTIKQWWPLAYPDEAYRRQIVTEWEARIAHAIETTSEIEPMEVVVTCKDGSKKDISWGFIATGKQNWAFGLNLTERKHAEEALRQEHQRLLDIIEFLPDAVFVIDQDKKVVAWNQAIETMSGVAKADMLGKGDYEYALPFFGARQPILIDLLDLPDEEIEKSYKYIKRDGKMIYAESYIPTLYHGRGAHLWGVAVPLYDGQGRRSGAIEAIRDVTELKNKEEALKRTNRALLLLSQCNTVIINAQEEGELLRRICHLIVESAGYIMAWVGYAEDDADKHVRPVAQYGFEDGYLDFIKISYGDSEYGKGPTGTVIRTGQRALLKNIMTDQAYAPWRDQALKRGYNSSIALPLASRGHTFGALNIYAHDPDAFNDDEATLLEELGANLAHGIMALRARSERAEAMAAIEQEHAELENRVQARTCELQEANTRLLELDRLKSMFIASVSHELRTPLNSIIGFSGVLLQGLSGELNPRQRDQMERIQRAGKHLVQLIMDVIDVSKIEAGNIPAVPSDFDLAELLHEAEQSLRADIEAKGLTLMVEAPDGIRMHTDRRRLLQCILNFLSNAYKFTPAGEIRMWAAADGEEISIHVADTGIGIPPEQAERLFQAFVRLDSPLKTTVPGTGLGLYLTRKIADELLEGRISMRGNNQQGSVFTIQVPQRLPDKHRETNAKKE